MNEVAPTKIDVRKDAGVTLEWPDGATSFYPVVLLRRLSPSAEVRELRQEQERNPLTVLPARVARGGAGGPLTIIGAELVGNYAIRIRFSDGHSTGIYSWDYLRSIDPGGSASGGVEGAPRRD